jgi:hypothetical protein
MLDRPATKIDFSTDALKANLQRLKGNGKRTSPLGIVMEFMAT